MNSQILGVVNPIELAFALVLQGVLIWFTYFSKNKLVKDHDKFAVFLMLCSAAAAYVMTGIRAFSAHS